MDRNPLSALLAADRAGLTVCGVASRTRGGTRDPDLGYSSSYSIATELMQNRFPVGSGPSSNT